MALRYFSNEEMVALTTPWVDPAHSDYQLLASRPVLAALLPELTAAHDGILAIVPAGEILERLDEISAEQGEVDYHHDRAMRGMFYRFQSERQLTDDEEVLDRIDEMQALILPQGLATTQKRYREEAGHAERVSAQISAEQRALLRQWTYHDGTMADVFDTWLALAARLGELDHERNGSITEREGRRRGANQRARLRWIRVVRLVGQNAELLGDDPEIAELLDRVARADLQRLERRARAARNDETAADEAAGDQAPGGEIFDDDVFIGAGAAVNDRPAGDVAIDRDEPASVAG